MILSSGPQWAGSAGGWAAPVAAALALAAAACYLAFGLLRPSAAALAGAEPLPPRAGWAGLHGGLLAALLLHAAALVWTLAEGAQTALWRLGFGSVLSLTVWLVVLVHALESRGRPADAVARALGIAGAASVLAAWWFPGEAVPVSSVFAPVHWLLGVGAYALFGAAVVHAIWLDESERRLRRPPDGSVSGLRPVAGRGMPLLQLERVTFRFVEAGFVALSAAIAVGALTAAGWRWDHKTVLSLFAWVTFGALLWGRHRQGWRGRQATRWVYAGTLLLLLAYVGSRFVLEIVLGRSVTG